MPRAFPVLFTRRNVQPPGALYISPDECLVLYMSPATANANAEVRVRMLFPDGQTNTLRLFVGTSAGFAGVNPYYPIPIPEGFLLGAQVRMSDFADGGSLTPTWVELYIARGLVGSFYTSTYLCSGYLGSHGPVSWPSPGVRHPHDGHGNVGLISTSPAAGTNWNLVATTNQQWRFLAVQAVLTTDATVVNRSVRLNCTSASGTVFRSVSPINQTASTTVVYSFARHGLGGLVGADQVYMPFTTELWFEVGLGLQCSVVGLQPGDVWTQVSAQYVWRQTVPSLP